MNVELKISPHVELVLLQVLSMHIKQDGKMGLHSYNVEVQGGLLEISFDFAGVDSISKNELVRPFTKVCLKGPARVVYNGIWAGN